MLFLVNKIVNNIEPPYSGGYHSVPGQSLPISWESVCFAGFTERGKGLFYEAEEQYRLLIPITKP
jgi:hypothetical protein